MADLHGAEPADSDGGAESTTLIDDEIETRTVGRAPSASLDDDTDTGDTGDDSDTGDDTGDDSDTGDDTGDDSDTGDVGDDTGDSGDDSADDSDDSDA